MSKTEFDEQDEKPLDPVMEKLRRKMVRLQVISAGVIVVSLMAVFSAIVYKASLTKQAATPVTAAVPMDAPLAANVAVPDGFKVETVSLSNGQILIYGSLSDGRRKAMVFDSASGRMLANLTLSGQ
jgi:hypothetical protein